MFLNFPFRSEKPVPQYLEERLLDQLGHRDSIINIRQSFQTLLNSFVRFVSLDLCRNLTSYLGQPTGSPGPMAVVTL